MSHTRVRARRISALAGAAVVAASLTLGQGPAAGNHLTVTEVTASAAGQQTSDITLFGGPQTNVQPVPLVQLNSTATNSPQTLTQDPGNVQFGPATLFSSGPITVSASGSVGPNGSVTATADVQDINQSRLEIFGEDNYDYVNGEAVDTPNPRPLTDISSTCSASEAGFDGSTTVTNGWLYIDSGWNDGDATYPESAENAGGTAEHDPVRVLVPTNPAPNTSYAGHIHLSGTSTDNYVIVFNEQTGGGATPFVVNAAHYYFGYTLVNGQRVADQNSVLRGEMIIGQVVCQVTTAPLPSTSSTQPSTSVTIQPTSSTSATTSTTAPTTTSSTSSSTSTSSTSTSTSSTSTSTSTTSTTTSTTLPTTTSSTTTSTTQPTTTSSTTTTISHGPTTTTTTVSGNTCVAQLEAIRDRVNAQIDAARAQVIAQVPADQQAPYLAQLEAARAQVNALINQAIALCP